MAQQLPFYHAPVGLEERSGSPGSIRGVCLRLQHTKDGWRGRLCWQLAPDDRKALDAVSDKVKGKMESAKLLSAVITLLLSFAG